LLIKKNEKNKILGPQKREKSTLLFAAHPTPPLSYKSPNQTLSFLVSFFLERERERERKREAPSAPARLFSLSLSLSLSLFVTHRREGARFWGGERERERFVKFFSHNKK